MPPFLPLLRSPSLEALAELLEEQHRREDEERPRQPARRVHIRAVVARFDLVRAVDGRRVVEEDGGRGDDREDEREGDEDAPEVSGSKG